MGGFEGGDEGGFWDEDAIATLIKTPQEAKTKENFEIDYDGDVSRIKVSQEGSCESISFIPCECESFSIENIENTTLKTHPLYKAYRALLEQTADTDIETYFETHMVVLQAKTSTELTLNQQDILFFMRLLKEACNLVISDRELQELSKD